MAKDKSKREPEAADSSDRGSARPNGGASGGRAAPTQLSGGRRVTADVGSIALDRLSLAGGSTKGTAELPAGLRGELIEPVVLEMLSDAEVMLRVATGDDVAFDYLVEKYRRQMVSFMYRMTHNQSVAEELAQEVFLRVYRSRQSYAASAKFTTWLYRIATNLAVNHARDTKHERPENIVNLDEPNADTGMTVDVADSGLNAEQSHASQGKAGGHSPARSRRCPSANARP